MASILTEEEKPGACKHCRKQFDYMSSFIRHVTHSKLCLETYDPEFIDRIKRESQLSSKKRCFANAWNTRLREERKQRRENIKSVNKNYYVSVTEKGSFKGKV